MNRPGRTSLSRRDVLRAGGAALLTGPAGLALSDDAVAQTTGTVRVWTTQGAPLQMQAYDYMVKTFEAAHPGTKVNLELFTDDDAWPKLTTAYAGKDVPDLVQHLTPEITGSLYDRGLVELMTDVVKEVGESDFQDSSRDIYSTGKGDYFATVIGNACMCTLWYRKDLLAEAGVKVPVYFDEWLDVAKKTTKGGRYGVALPYGKKGMSNYLLFFALNASGGWVIDPDMQVTFNSPQTVAALEFLKEMRQYNPPGANNYSFNETLGAYVSGVAATSIYTGRVLGNVETQNPKISEQIACARFPMRREGGRPWASCSFASQFIPKGAKNVAAAKRFAVWQYKPDVYIRFLHSAPGHLLPSLTSIGASKAYLDNPVLEKHKPEVAQLLDNVSFGRSASKPSPKHKFIYKAGDIIGSDVMAEVLQRVVVENVPAKTAAAWGQDRIAQIMKS
jgi:multiple sugar transport system substrate-binding protein